MSGGGVRVRNGMENSLKAFWGNNGRDRIAGKWEVSALRFCVSSLPGGPPLPNQPRQGAGDELS